MAVIWLADGLVERLVLDVIQPAAVKSTRGERRGVAGRDELRQKVVRLLPVCQASERPVLPFEEHPGEDQHMDQKPCLALGEPPSHEGADSRRTDAVTEANRDGLHHRNSSATRGSNARPPLRPPPPRPKHRNPARATLAAW